MTKKYQKAQTKPQCVAGKASKDAKNNKAATSCVACLQQKKCCKNILVNHATQDSMEKNNINMAKNKFCFCMYQMVYDADEGKKVAKLIKNRAEYIALRNSAENLSNLKKAREGDAEAKRKLLQICYNLGADRNGFALKNCKSQGSFFGLDIDCNADEAEQIKESIMSKKTEIGLMMLERTVNNGFHLVCRRIQGTTILENQVRVANMLHVEMDTNAKDLHRVFFTTSGEDTDLIYLDDELFTEPMLNTDSLCEYQRMKDRADKGEEDVPPGAKKANKHYRPWEDIENGKQETEQSTCQPEQSTCQLSFKGIPYTRIIEMWWQHTGGEPAEGERNTKLFQLAANLRAICDNNREKLMQVMPRYGLPESEIRSIIDSACKEPVKGVSKLMQEILNEIKSSEQNTSQTPPPMPEKLPKLIKLLVSETPDIYKPAVANAVFPALAAHLHGVWFKYTDARRHEAALMHVLMAPSGAGKSSIDEPVSHIMADIKKRDNENMIRENEWKKECRGKAANKNKPPRPEGLIIQCIPTDITMPAFIQRLDENDGNYCYAHLDEIEKFDQFKGKTCKEQFTIIKCAFDNFEYGQARVSAESVTATPLVRFNFNASTTIKQGQEYFRNVLTDGPMRRLNISTIPEQKIGAPQPIYGVYDEKFDKKLKPYINNLTTANGEIKCSKASELAKKMIEKCSLLAEEAQDRVYWNLATTACVIAWRKALVLYIANGKKWEDEINDFIMWSLDYDLWCKMHFFGYAIEKAEKCNGSTLGRKGPKSIIEELQDQFTFDDVMNIMLQKDKKYSPEKCRKLINVWKTRHKIDETCQNNFVKLK